MFLLNNLRIFDTKLTLNSEMFKLDVKKVCTTFFAQDIKDYQNGSKVKKGWNLKMFILGFLLLHQEISQK